MSYDNTNTGALFKNDRKETDSHPDYTGSFNKDGVEHFLSAWLNESKGGKKYLSVKLGNVKDQQQAPERPAPQQQAPAGDFDDSIPF